MVFFKKLSWVIKHLPRLVYYIKHNAILAKLFTCIRTGFKLYFKSIC